MNDREIKYLLTGDASKLKSELTAVQKQAEEAGKSIDRALTNAMKGAAGRMTADFGKNLEAINKGLSNVQKGTQNAFNAQSIAQYAKGQSAVATQLQRLEQQYSNLDRTATSYRRTLVRTGTDAATASSITTQWLDRQRSALQESGRAAGNALGQQFGGLARLAPSIAIGIQQVDDEAKAAAASANKLVNQIGGAFGKAARNQISSGSRAILDFGSAIGSATQDLMRLGFGITAALAAFTAIPLLKTITMIESAQLGLESLLSSAEEAGAAIFRIYEFANQTAYPTANLIAYEQKLVSVGLSAEQAFGVIARVSDIGGAFGATGDQLDRFYYVLSQIFGAGRAMGQDFLQIQNSLPGFISAIGQAMGKSAGEVREAFGDGSVTSQVIADALNILTEEGGKAFQGAARQSSTLSGMMNNLVDNLKRVGMAFFGVRITMDGMQPSVDGLYEKIKRLVGTILAFAENPLAVRAFEILGDAIGSIVTVLERFPQVIGIAAGLFISFATELITRIPFIGNLIGGISYGVGFLLGLFVAMVSASRDLQNALIAVAGQFLSFLQSNSGLFVALLANFKTLLATLGQGVAPALIILTQLFLNFAQAVLNIINFFLVLGNTIATFLGPEFTRAITLTMGFITVALMLAPVINGVIGSIVALQVAISSLAFRIAMVITIILALIGVLLGLFGKKPETKSIDVLSGIFDDIGGTSVDASRGIDQTTDSITDAGKAAAKASKQLAAFDKMNVINSPTSSGADSNAGGPGNISGLTPPSIPEPDFEGLKNKFKSMFKDIEDAIPKFSWQDFVVPGLVFAGLIALSKLLGKINWAEVFGMLWINIQIIFGKIWKFLLGFVTKVPIWGWALAAAVAVALLVAFNWDKIQPVLAQLGEIVMNAFNKVVEVIQQILPKIPGIIADLIGAAVNVFNTLKTAIPIVIRVAGEIMISLIGTITKALPGIVEAGLNIVVGLLGALVNALPQFLGFGVKVIQAIIAAIVGSITLIVTAATSIVTTLLNVLIAALPMLMTAAIEIAMVLINALVNALPLLLETAIVLVTTLLNAIIEMLPTIIEAGVTLIVTLIEGIVSMLPQIIEAAVTLILTLLNGVISMLPKIIDAAVTLVITLVETLIDNLPMLIDAAIVIILTVALALIDNLPKIIDAAFRLIMALVKGLIDNLPKIIDAAIRLIGAIVTALINNLPKLIDAAIRIIVALATGLWNNREKILKAIADIGAKIVEKLGQINWGQVGRDLVQGLWNGINNMGHWIGEKIKGFGKGVTDSLKNFFGIKSPSRMMRDQIGKMLGEGIGVGIEQSTNGAVDAARKSAASIGKALGAIDTNTVIGVSKDYIGSVSQAITTSGEMISAYLEDPTTAVVESNTNTNDAYSNGLEWVEALVNKLDSSDSDEPTVVNVYLDGNKVGGAVSNSINNRSMVTGVNQIYV